MFYGNIVMYEYNYNRSNAFFVNKKMHDYLKLYKDNLLKDILKKQTPKINTFTKPFPPIDPNIYSLLFPVTNILAFLAGYYSHYFLNK